MNDIVRNKSLGWNKVIYYGVLTTVWVRLSKFLDSFKQPVLVKKSLFQLLQFFNFYKQWFPFRTLLFRKNCTYKNTIMFPYKMCVTEKRT